MALSVASYNTAERRAIERQPNRITEACRPELFLKAGYPVEVTSEQGLVRFVDVMHENRDAIDYEELLSGFSRDEFDLFREITRKVAEFSETLFGNRLLPKGALTRAMLSYRHIRMLVQTGACVFEVGPGSGYLGALLATAGYRYGAMDITQGFYLYQSHLWDYLFGSRFLELADSDRTFIGFGELPESCVLHVPWWKYTVTEPARIDVPVDLYVANHALCEMNLYSMCYTMRLAQQLLSKSKRHGLFFVEGMGGDMLRSRGTALNYFAIAKFARVFDDGGLIDVLTPVDRMKDFVVPSPARPANERAANDSPPALSLAARLRRGARYVKKVIRSNGGILRTSVKAARRFVGSLYGARLSVAMAQISEKAQMPDPHETSVHHNIMAGRDTIARKPKVPFDEVRNFQRSLVSNADIRSGDEMFFQYVFGADFYS